jgi:hypothetical protein
MERLKYNKMNSKIKKVIWVVTNTVVLVGLSFIQRQYFPETLEIPVIDSTAVVQHQSQVDSLSTVIAGLKEELNKKPKVIIRKVPIHTIVRKDSIIYKDSVTIKEIVITDTIVLDPPITEESDNIISVNTEGKQYLGELFVLGKKDRTIVKTKKKYFKKGDILYISDGENLDSSLGFYFTGDNIKKRLKFNTPTVYILGVSSDKSIEDRIAKLIRNRNIL